MATINTATLLHDTTVYLRDILLTNLTDPISATRSSNSKFVMTSFPQRPVEYPIITLDISSISDESLGISTEASKVKMDWIIQIWSKSTKQRDEIYDELYNFLRTFQLDTAGTVKDAKLFDFKLNNAFNLDEEGKHGIHRKIIEGSYSFFTET